MGSLQAFVAKRKDEGAKSRTINNALALIRHILNLAASEWRDEQGPTWLEHAPKIKLLQVRDGRRPYPLSREEQTLRFQELPDHLARMALFKVNTGCRDQEVCGLKWDDEVKVPELDTSVFIIPGDRVKNAQDRLVVLNRIARSWWRLRGGSTRTMCSPTCRSEGMRSQASNRKGRCQCACST